MTILIWILLFELFWKNTTTDCSIFWFFIDPAPSASHLGRHLDFPIWVGWHLIIICSCFCSWSSYGNQSKNGDTDLTTFFLFIAEKNVLFDPMMGINQQVSNITYIYSGICRCYNHIHITHHKNSWVFSKFLKNQAASGPPSVIYLRHRHVKYCEDKEDASRTQDVMTWCCMIFCG